MILIGLACTGAQAASNSDYGADYTDDSPVVMHADVTSSSLAPASTATPGLDRPARRVLSPGDRAIGVQSDAPNPAVVPVRGDSRQSVRSAYGVPLSVHDPVGQPPITRWDYPAFRVYFEYEHVIHSVIPGRPEPIDHARQLD